MANVEVFCRQTDKQTGRTTNYMPPIYRRGDIKTASISLKEILNHHNTPSKILGLHDFPFESKLNKMLSTCTRKT